MFIFRRTVLLFMIVLLPTVVLSQTENIDADAAGEDVVSETIVPSLEPELSPYIKGILVDLEKVQLDVEANRFTSAITLVNTILDRLIQERKLIISKFFPATFEGFVSDDQTLRYESLFSTEDEFGVLFSRQYQNPEGHTIDVSVVFSDPSIQDYINIVRKPKLVNNLANAELITVKDAYPAIQKFSEELRSFEQNIVVSEDLLLNVVANGVDDKALLTRYVSLIELELLDEYLRK